MDKTETFVKMCEKAEEIQEAFKTTEPINYACMDSGHFIAHWYEEDKVHKYVSLLGESIELDRYNWCLFRPGEGWGSHTPEKYQRMDELFVWLPRQDQLQEMVRGNKHNHLLAHEFAFYWHGGEEFHKLFTGHVAPSGCESSMEQLWLAFVMKEKYNKTWDGEKWHGK